MRIPQISSTDLFTGSVTGPRQVVRVKLANEGPGSIGEDEQASVRVEGATVATPVAERVTGLPRGESRVVEVGVTVAAPAAPGSTRRVTAVVETAGDRYVAEGEITVAAPGWTMWMVSHFHYDPVWWNTQAGFTEVWYDLPLAEQRRPPVVKTAFDLVRAHLHAARHDADYKFVLAEIDYLKPHWDAYPEDRADLRRFLTEGRVELVGGNYNEANTNLTHPESTIRNAIYGIGYQRDVIGGDPRSAWMLDVFGHDPAYPGLMADAGLDSSAWARGPFHMWGPNRHVGDNRRMQFPSEFEWLAPQGDGVLTAYMANHYGAGWVMDDQATSLDEAMELAYTQFTELKTVAATHNVLLPVGGDHVVPSRWCTEVHREWADRYVWPRFTVGLPRDFFAAVRAELCEAAPARTAARFERAARAEPLEPQEPAGPRHSPETPGTPESPDVGGPPETGGPLRRLTPQSRDMNPVYTGKDVSYIDTKQAQRAAEVAVLDAERLATLAGVLSGARYPSEELDKAWRQLAFGAHHDAVTGTESDQVYLDLLAGWREAYELGDEARRAAVAEIAAQADTTGIGRPVIVANTLSWTRDGVTTVRLAFPAPGPVGMAVHDDEGATVPAVTESIRRHPTDGAAAVPGVPGIAEITVTFVARRVPSLGYRVFQAVPDDGVPAGWSTATATETGGETAVTAANHAFRVTADPAAGGALRSIRDLRADRELLRPGRLGNELVVQEEYDTHPKWNEGPWHLLPKGPGRGTGAEPAEVRLEESPIGRRIVTETALDELRITQHVTLYGGIDRVDFHSHVDGSIGHDRLLRVRFGLDVPGARPVAETGFAAIGRSFGFPDADAGPTPWTLDCPAHNWVALSSAVRVALNGADGTRAAHAIGVAEVVEPDGGRYAGEVRDLVRALGRQGVTATCGRPDGPRYGALDVDSNLPDVRIALGGPADNAFSAAVLAAAGRDHAMALERHGRVFVPPVRPLAEVWSPDADLRGERDLPVLIVAGAGPAARDLGAVIGALAADLADATIEVACPTAGSAQVPGGGGSEDSGSEDPEATAPESLADYSVGLLNAGTPGTVVGTDGTVHLNLMRSCSAWPCGDWLDGERRTVPDGSSFAWQHWSHTFGYSLVAGEGDWRVAGFVQAGQEYNHAVLAQPVEPHDGPLPASASLAAVRPSRVVLTTLKPHGNPLAAALPGDEADVADGIVVRAYESTGRPAQAQIEFYGGLVDARAVNILEEPRLGAAPLSGGGPGFGGPAVTVDLAGTEVMTVCADPAGASRERGGSPASPREPAQPVFTRYWLHNRGSAPIGNLPVAVHVSPPKVRLADDVPARVRVTVAASGRPAAGLVELAVPGGLAITVGGDGGGSGSPVEAPRLTYDLAPGEHVAYDLDVAIAPGGGFGGSAYLAARIRDELGQILEDATAVVAEPAEPAEPARSAERADSAEPAERADSAGGADSAGSAEGAEPVPAAEPVEVTVEPAGLELSPGGAGEIVVRLTNRTRGAVRGEAQLVSPIGTWGPAAGASITPWTQGFAVAAGAETELRFRVRVPGESRPDAHWWALVKVACFGRLHYTPTIPIEIR